MRNFNVTVNGKSYSVQVEEVGGGNAVATSQPVVAAPVVAPKAPVVAGGVELKSPMPGMVVNFKVENGASVKKGQTVVILEAMKMENDIPATADGVITLVASKGATVDTGDVLAIIK